MNKPPPYRNAASDVRNAVIEKIARLLKAQGKKVPPDMIERCADDVMEAFEKKFKRVEFWRRLAEGLLINLIWWVAVAAIGIAYWWYSPKP